MLRSVLVKAVVAAALGVAVLLVQRQVTLAEGLWTGVVGSAEANVRAAPTTESAVVGTVAPGTPIQVITWVPGERVLDVNETWAEIGPGQYVYSAMLLKPTPNHPPPVTRTFAGHWIDANLTQQVLTAYDGTTPVFWAVMSSGAPGTATDPGVQRILRRVANETMSSATLSVPVEIPYYLTNVLWTQYFTTYGAAIHDNWWKGVGSPYYSPFGVPTSHGCIGLPEPDALKFWNWAQDGTIVNIHY
jgi:lipoprotein-anchoring transpeptidase ErfK/SrfK